MKEVAAYTLLSEAHAPLSRLHSAGIAAVLRDDGLVWADWFSANAVGGVKIDVPDEDYATAVEIVRLAPSEEGLLKCPHCGSCDVLVRILSPPALLCVLLKLPIPIKWQKVDCRSCGKNHYSRSHPQNG